MRRSAWGVKHDLSVACSTVSRTSDEANISWSERTKRRPPRNFWTSEKLGRPHEGLHEPRDNWEKRRAKKGPWKGWRMGWWILEKKQNKNHQLKPEPVSLQADAGSVRIV